VFGPAKRKWRVLLREWKEECEREGRLYPTIPKHEFPYLLGNLLKHDFGDAIRSGFECCGFIPVSVDRVLQRLPPENPDVTTEVQRQLLKQLQHLRYDKITPAKAPRPKKADKLPAGASYTCQPDGPLITGPGGDEDNEVQPVAGSSGVQTTTRHTTSIRPGSIPVPALISLPLPGTCFFNRN